MDYNTIITHNPIKDEKRYTDEELRDRSGTEA
jgi:hypothetical protein